MLRISGESQRPREAAPLTCIHDSAGKPLASAAVLGIAERLLAAPDEETANEALKGVIERSNRASANLGYQFRSTRRASVPFRVALRCDRRPWVVHDLPSRAELILKHPGMTRIGP